LLGIVSMVINLIPLVGSLITMVLIFPAQNIALTLIYLGLRKKADQQMSSEVNESW